jgi:hypothetical protein
VPGRGRWLGYFALDRLDPARGMQVVGGPGTLPGGGSAGRRLSGGGIGDRPAGFPHYSESS